MAKRQQTLAPYRNGALESVKKLPNIWNEMTNCIRPKNRVAQRQEAPFFTPSEFDKQGMTGGFV
jgi:hypothetical protein